MSDARLFVTDYASYNDGSQFQFGHWVELDDFNDAEEFFAYVYDHLKTADKKSPLDEWTTREEPMFTDSEGFPDMLYGESMSLGDVQKIYDYMAVEKELENNLVGLWNVYCSEVRSENYLYDFDDDFFNTFFEGNPEGAARAAFFTSNFNWGHDYIYFNGYGNLETCADPEDHIDKDELISAILEDPSTYSVEL